MTDAFAGSTSTFGFCVSCGLSGFCGSSGFGCSGVGFSGFGCAGVGFSGFGCDGVGFSGFGCDGVVVPGVVGIAPAARIVIVMVVVSATPFASTEFGHVTVPFNVTVCSVESVGL